MDEHVLHLTDGTTVSARVNFGTLYYMEKFHVDKLAKDEMTDDDAMEAAARMLHVLLLSNGRTVSFQEALVLCPIDTDEVMNVFADFKNRLEDFKKKETAKQQMTTFVTTKAA